ncbi:MAG TPA: hypothetical protein VMJ93_02995 [Verrucomicrobiae bacterium]|nr:hypothetical protein [Verrucomicrobiae bacterium]
MSSVSSPLGTFYPQAFSPPAAYSSSRSQRLQPADQPPSAPVDTVTISGYVPQSPSSASQPAQNQSLAAASPPIPSPATPPPTNAGTSAGQAPATQTPADGPATPVTGSGSGASAAAAQTLPDFIGSLPSSQQQEVAQLDQLLEQLGIDPNSIPVSEQLSMVLDLNNPAALVKLVQSLGEVVQSPPSNPAAATSQNPAPQNAAPVANALVSANSANQNSNPAASNESQPELQAAPAGNAAVPANSPGASANFGFASQFQELQLSLEAIGAGGFAPPAAQSPARSAPPAGFTAQGQSLNVVA